MTHNGLPIVHSGVTHDVRKGKPFPVYWDVVREGGSE
jgi:NADH:ubiquinone oxidoreductase subunit D